MKSFILVIVSIVFLCGCDDMILKTPEDHPPREIKWETCYYYAKIKVETVSGSPCDSAQAFIIVDNAHFKEADSLGIIRGEISYNINQFGDPDSPRLVSTKVYKYLPSTPDCPFRERFITFQHGPNEIVNPDSFWAEITPHIVVFPDYP